MTEHVGVPSLWQQASSQILRCDNLVQVHIFDLMGKRWCLLMQVIELDGVHHWVVSVRLEQCEERLLLSKAGIFSYDAPYDSSGLWLPDFVRIQSI